MRQCILIVEDEEKIAEVLLSYLKNAGYQVLAADCGERAMEIVRNYPVSLVLLDLMLPDLSGEEICRRIRSFSRLPIIMVTAKSAEEDLLEGLRVGADDYITKPFSLKEVKARIETLLRRCDDHLQPLADFFSFGEGDLLIDISGKMVRKKGQVVHLTPSEFAILEVCMGYPSKVFTREELIEVAFGESFDGYDRAVDTHVKNLRQKIEDDPRHPVYLKTVHGRGYRFGGI